MQKRRVVKVKRGGYVPVDSTVAMNGSYGAAAADPADRGITVAANDVSTPPGTTATQMSIPANPFLNFKAPVPSFSGVGSGVASGRKDEEIRTPSPTVVEAELNQPEVAEECGGKK